MPFAGRRGGKVVVENLRHKVRHGHECEIFCQPGYLPLGRHACHYGSWTRKPECLREVCNYQIAHRSGVCLDIGREAVVEYFISGFVMVEMEEVNVGLLTGANAFDSWSEPFDEDIRAGLLAALRPEEPRPPSTKYG